MMWRRPQVGLDVGQHAIKLLVMHRNTVQVAEAFPTFPSREGRDPLLDEAYARRRLAELSPQLHKAYPAVEQGINVSPPGTGTMGRYIELGARLRASELPVAARAQALVEMPYGADEAWFSLQQVPPIVGRPDASAVFVVADPKSRVASWKQLVAAAGLRLQRLEVPLLSLARAERKNHAPQTEFVAAIQVGFQLSHVLVTRGGFPYYYREVPIGGRDFTYAFQQAMQCSWVEAEACKLRSDLLAEEAGVEPVLGRWLSQMRTSMQAFCRQFPDQHVTRILLSGGSAAWKNLAPRLSSALEVPVSIDTWDRIAAPAALEDGAPTFMAAAGLAASE